MIPTSPIKLPPNHWAIRQFKPGEHIAIDDGVVRSLLITHVDMSATDEHGSGCVDIHFEPVLNIDLELYDPKHARE